MTGGQTLQFRSNSILAYYKRKEKSTFRSLERQRSIENLLEYSSKEIADKGTYSGLVTSGSQKRLTKALENMLQIAEWKTAYHSGPLLPGQSQEYRFKINFVTLTLYSFNRRVPGKEAHKRCLEPLLRWLRTKGMTCYIWKAELQTKRKDCHQLHYHLTTDIYIDKYELRDKWNELQKSAGYLDTFHKKFGHWDANSTDVHATHNKKNLIGYLKKAIVRYSNKQKYKKLRNNYLIRAELAKADQNKETIEGKVWDSSQNVKTSFFEIAAYHDITKKIAEAVALKEIDVMECERCTVYQMRKTTRDASSYLPYRDRLFYKEHIDKMRTYERLKPDINTFSSS